MLLLNGVTKTAEKYYISQVTIYFGNETGLFKNDVFETPTSVLYLLLRFITINQCLCVCLPACLFVCLLADLLTPNSPSQFSEP